MGNESAWKEFKLGKLNFPRFVYNLEKNESGWKERKRESEESFLSRLHIINGFLRSEVGRTGTKNFFYVIHDAGEVKLWNSGWRRRLSGSHENFEAIKSLPKATKLKTSTTIPAKA
jgi:hypothetical protein